MIQIGDESTSGHALLCVNYSLLFQPPQGFTNRGAARDKLFGQGPLIWQSIPNLKLACKDGVSYLLQDFVGNSLVFDWLKHIVLQANPLVKKVEWTDQLYSSFPSKDRTNWLLELCFANSLTQAGACQDFVEHFASLPVDRNQR